MDNIKMDYSSLAQQGNGYKIQQHSEQRLHKILAKSISFIGAFLILLASVFAVNISTIDSVEAKSQSAQNKVKKKRFIKTSRKSRRHKKSRRSIKGKKHYKKHYKKSRHYRKGKKRFYKASYKKSKRYRKGKKRYKRSRKRNKRSRRRYRTCDQLSSATLNRKARRYQKTINHAARKHGVSQHFVKAIITVETCFRSGLRGTSGEKGLMQLMPATARRFGVKNRFSAWDNIHGGTRYLSYLLRHFRGNKAYAAAAYNGGRGAVSKKHGPKFAAVRRYSRKVMNAYRKFRPRRIQVKSRKRKSKRKNKS
jgi:soluble lytic murein transglycosylase-like protein